MRRALIPALIALASATPATSSTLDTTTFFTQLTPLNDSGVSGRVEFAVDRAANTLTANVRASGLTPNTPHPQHIHGRFEESSCEIDAGSGSPIAGLCLRGPETRDSVVPSLAGNDIDGDGFLETVEGAPSYGPILLNLADASQPRSALPGSFPTSDAAGNLMFTETYDLDTTDLLFDPANGIEHDPADLFALSDRVYVIHGVTVNADDAGVPNDRFEVQGPTDGPEFIAMLPAAAGDIAPVPVPAALPLLGAGVAALGLMRRRRTPRA